MIIERALLILCMGFHQDSVVPDSVISLSTSAGSQVLLKDWEFGLSGCFRMSGAKSVSGAEIGMPAMPAMWATEGYIIARRSCSSRLLLGFGIGVAKFSKVGIEFGIGSNGGGGSYQGNAVLEKISVNWVLSSNVCCLGNSEFSLNCDLLLVQAHYHWTSEESQFLPYRWGYGLGIQGGMGLRLFKVLEPNFLVSTATPLVGVEDGDKFSYPSYPWYCSFGLGVNFWLPGAPQTQKEP